MRYHELVLIPATGHFGPGVYDPGPNYGHFFELDIARELLTYIEEELDNDRVRCRLFKLWEGPGFTREEIGRQMDQTSISLHLSFGRGGTTREWKNATRSWYSDPGAAWLAQILSEAVADWAKCSNFDHEMSKPRLKEEFFPKHAVLIEPFSLALGSPDMYLVRLRDLAKTMAQTIYEFFQRSDQAMRSRPLGAWTNDKKKNDDDRHLVTNFLKADDNGQLEPFKDFQFKDFLANLPAQDPAPSSHAEPQSSAPGDTDQPLAPDKRSRRGGKGA